MPRQACLASPGYPAAVRHPAPALATLVVLLLCLTAACAGPGRNLGPGTAEPLPTGLVGPIAPTTGPGALRYVALGDSYTYGVGVAQSDRWPNQLVRILRPDLDFQIVANLAGRSTATQQVINDQLPRLEGLRPEFVTIQVGINDIINPSPDPDMYRQNLETIFDAVLALGVPADRIVFVTMPDFTLFPQGDAYGEPEIKHQRVGEYNEIARQVAAARGITVVDVSPISDRVPLDPGLVASDGFDPSGKQYAAWADLIAEKVLGLFGIHSAGTPNGSGAAASNAPPASRGADASIAAPGVPVATPPVRASASSVAP